MYHSVLGSAWLAITVVFPAMVLTAALHGRPETFSVGGVTWLLDWPTALGIFLVGVAVYIPVAICLQRKLKKFLASTEWARAQGYTVDDL